MAVTTWQPRRLRHPRTMLQLRFIRLPDTLGSAVTIIQPGLAGLGVADTGLVRPTLAQPGWGLDTTVAVITAVIGGAANPISR